MVEGSCAGALFEKLTSTQLEETAAVARRAGEINTTGFASTRAAPGRPAGRGRARAVTAYGGRHRAGPTDQPASGWGTYARQEWADPGLVERYDKAMPAVCNAMAAVDEPRDPAGYRLMQEDLARVQNAHPRFVPACASHNLCIIGNNASNATHLDRHDARGCFSLVASFGETAVCFALPEFQVVVEIALGSVFAFNTVECEPPPPPDILYIGR